MNDFTKEELECARDALELWNSKHICSDMRNINLKIQSMIDNYCEHEEKEIFSCYTGLGVADDFFCKQQHMSADDLLPVISQLVNQCDGMIKESGVYAIKLRIDKIK